MNPSARLSLPGDARHYDEIALLRREVEARFGRQGGVLEVRRSVTQPSRGQSDLRRAVEVTANS